MAAKLIKLKFDSQGFAEVLNSPETRAMVTDAASRIAQAAQAMAGTVPVAHRDYTTDRAASAVDINDDRGMTMQAEHGVLTRAAGSIGAEVRAK